MADAAVVVLKRLLPKIEKIVQDEVCLVLNSRKEAETLDSTLKRIQKVLKDAEKKSITDPRVIDWLEKIKDAAYEMDDALDEWEMKILELQLEPRSRHVSDLWEKVSSFIESLVLCCQDALERRSIAWKIKQLNGRLEKIAEENDKDFKFLPDVGSRDSQDDSQHLGRSKLTTYVDLSKIKGRVNDKNIILSKLLSMRKREDNDLQIISIVGTGGLGKTTLAQLVLHDSSVQEYFQLKPLVTVSDNFGEIKIASSILKSLGKESQNDNDLERVLECLESSISGKRFLVILDNVWPHEQHQWIPLRVCLSKGAPGSRILVTTRIDTVASAMGSDLIHKLGPLSDPECWSLLSEIALQERKEDRDILEDVGRKIAIKCKGFPLAATTLGKLLCSKDTVEEWEEVLMSEIWQLEIAEVKLFPHLYLSYKELPHMVKRCFSYCATFKKDSIIDVDRLIRMWMAQGFLLSRGEEKMEQNGREYFKCLAARSFFKDFRKDEEFGERIVSCKMHDIIHDFAQFLTRNECFIVGNLDGRAETGKDVFFPNARHLAWHDNGKNLSPISVCSVEKLRSFLCRKNIPPLLFKTLKCVRELSLFNCKLQELPPETGNLIHLRYLDLRHNPIKKLPDTLCGLYKLETLDVEGCDLLSELPEEISKLINLRHLLNYMTSLEQLPQGIEKLTHLRTLSQFYVGRGRPLSKLGYLKNLNQLEGYLFIHLHDLNEEADAIEAENGQLKNKTRIQTLYLRFTGEVLMNVIEAMQAPPNLRRLVLSGYEGSQFPKWLTMSIKYLKVLEMRNSETISSLPRLWELQFLEKLSIRHLENLKCLSHEFLGIADVSKKSTARVNYDGSSPSPSSMAVRFPKLKSLQFKDCEFWTEWKDIPEEGVFSMMPHLQVLEVIRCRKLKALPHRLLLKTQLEYLTIGGSRVLVERYCTSRTGDEWKKISHIPHIQVQQTTTYVDKQRV